MTGAADLLDELAESCRHEQRPWGSMRWLDAPGHDLTVKYLDRAGRASGPPCSATTAKTSCLIVLGGTGFSRPGRCATAARKIVRITPGVCTG